MRKRDIIFRLAVVFGSLATLWSFFVDGLGADPALQLNHHFGKLAVWLLTANFLIGSVAAIKKNKLILLCMRQRRFLGIYASALLLTHVSFYFINEAFEWNAVTQLYQKTYLILGSLAFFIFMLLAISSNNFAVRKLRIKRWKNLHRLGYLAFALAYIHISFIEKMDIKEYLPYFVAVLLFWLWRAGSAFVSTNKLFDRS